MSGWPSLTQRFADPETEAGFQAERVRALEPIIRVGLLTGIALWLTIGVLPLLIGHANELGVLAIVAFMSSVNVVIFLLLGRLLSVGSVNAIGAVSCGLSGLAVIVLLPVSGLADLSVYVVPALMLVSTYAFVVFQLAPGRGLGVGAVCLVAYLFGPISHQDAVLLVLDVVLIVSAVGLGAGGSFLLERSTRERYLQSRLIEAQAAEIAGEQAKSDRLLLNVLPARIAARLRDEPGALAEQFEAATVLFADLVSFTSLSERIGPQRTAEMLNNLVSRFDDLTEQFGLEKIKTIGDAYLVVGGVPEALADHAVRVVGMGLAMLEATAACAAATELPLALRIGVHSGPVVAGVIGRTKFAYDVWGDTVNVASRLESAGVPGEVQASQTTVGLLGSSFDVEPRGPIELRGKGTVVTFLVRAHRTRAALGTQRTA